MGKITQRLFASLAPRLTLATKSREAEARHKLVAADELIARVHAQLADCEAREANARSMLLDYQNLLAECQQELAACEAREAEAKNRLAAAEQNERERLAAQSGLASSSDSPLEALLAEYGLVELSRLVKTRRVSDEHRHSMQSATHQDIVGRGAAMSSLDRC